MLQEEEAVEEEEDEETEEDAIDRMKSEIAENYDSQSNLVQGVVVSSFTFLSASLACYIFFVTENSMSSDGV